MKRKNVTSDMMKEYISEALVLLLDKKVYCDITISEITNKAGVNRSTYYRNFSSKEDVVKYYYSNILKNYIAGVDKNVELHTYLFDMFEFYLRYKKQLLLLHKNNLSYLLLQSFNEEFEAKSKSNSLDEKFHVYYHTGGIFNSFLLWFESNMDISAQELAIASLNALPANTKPLFIKTR